MKIDNNKIEKRNIKSLIKQKPNKKVLGLKFSLSIYSLAGKEDKGVNKWLRKIGEEPVVYDSLLARRTKEQIKLYLVNKGYRNAEVNKRVKYPARKKAKVVYNIETNEPFRIDKIDYHIEDSNIYQYVMKDTVNSLIGEGSLFDVKLLEKERKRIANVIKRKGFYNFSREYIYYKADTSNQTRKVDLSIGVKKYSIKNEEGQIAKLNHPVYKINDIYIYTEYEPKKYLVKNQEYLSSLDTLVYEGIYFIYKDEISIKPETLLQSVFIKKDSLYK